MKKKKSLQQEALQPISDDTMEQISGGAVDLLNSNIGLEQMLPSANMEHLEKTQQIVSSQDINEVKLQDLYREDNLRRFTLSAMVPSISTDEVLQPANMNNSLHSSFESLSAVKDQDIQQFVNNDLKMIMENQDIYNAYLQSDILG